MEKEKNTLEKEVRTQVIKEGSLKKVIRRCVDRILLGKFDGHHFEVDKISKF